PLDTPIADFALDLLLGKPCLVVTHHHDFRGGMRPLVSLVSALNALEPQLRWTNLESIISETYSIRRSAVDAVDVRLFASSTRLGVSGVKGLIRCAKAEPLTDRDFKVVAGGQPVRSDRTDGDIIFSTVIASDTPNSVDVRVTPPAPVPLAVRPLRYRSK